MCYTACGGSAEDDHYNVVGKNHASMACPGMEYCR